MANSWEWPFIIIIMRKHRSSFGTRMLSASWHWMKNIQRNTQPIWSQTLKRIRHTCTDAPATELHIVCKCRIRASAATERWERVCLELDKIAYIDAWHFWRIKWTAETLVRRIESSVTSHMAYLFVDCCVSYENWQNEIRENPYAITWCGNGTQTICSSWSRCISTWKKSQDYFKCRHQTNPAFFFFVFCFSRAHSPHLARSSVSLSVCITSYNLFLP